ncbi:MerR family transcriptional regulator [Terribacillus saccharophilus]|uniref:HTH merR-type domain-containing protein n=1 Tax=Terribacillus saccharophilus TaxID=361277 RepID=A0ABX4GYF9_9BACI|nr:MerR family transcriptional regulator [Terribacillus saccharophilus]PAD35789.1 hypothetical protein CHH56_07705 [Terribacillus saccharophilus]PAD96340.1 hypothetical protein CHH50_08850 [Terribacillus saccharophilus]PAD99915.1 hypothetical protein CHH48_09755 [Terribacillus saccharophilus]
MKIQTFTIQKVSDMTGLSPHTLRYYEELGLLNKIGRNEHSYRMYTQADISWIHFLLRLRSTSMPIAQMQQFSSLRSMGDETIALRLELLENHHNQVQEQIDHLTENLDKIARKIHHYKELLNNGSK